MYRMRVWCCYMTDVVNEKKVKDLYLASCGNSLESTLLYTAQQKRLGTIKFLNI